MARKRKSKPKPKPKPQPQPKADEPTPEEIAKLKVVEVPAFYASTFRIAGSGNDFSLIFQRTVAMQTEDGGIHPTVGSLETVAIVTVSPQSLKDLHLLIGRQVEQQEKEFGRIKTPYTIRLAEQKP